MHKTKSVLAVVLALALALSCVILGGCGTKSEIVGINTKSDTTAPADTSAASAVSADEPATLSPDGYNKPYTGTSRKVEIDVKDMGVITVELDDTYAPLTVQNFLNLVNEGFYDGLTFHRIISGFMIQGGDPLGTGTGGSTNKIKGEFSRNGVKNELPRQRQLAVLHHASGRAPPRRQLRFLRQGDERHGDRGQDRGRDPGAGFQRHRPQSRSAGHQFDQNHRITTTVAAVHGNVTFHPFRA